MPICTNCKYNKIKFAPYIKARVATCTKVGECEQVTKTKESKQRRERLGEKTDV